MQVTKKPGESDQAFRARAFEANRAACNCNQGRLLCSCLNNGDCSECNPRPARPFIQATKVSFAELHAKGVPLAFGPTVAMSRVRTIWYGAGLVFGAALIAMAVFGMGR